jgi:two-component system, response regulator, stage 0 sporulation protein F
MSRRSPPTPTRPHGLRIFLAEDDEQMRRLVAHSLRRHGHFVLEAGDGPGLLAHLGEAYTGASTGKTPSAIIADMRMPGCDGLSVFRGLRREPWCPPFILITAFADPRLHAEAAALGAHAVVDKPFDLEDMCAIVNRIRRGKIGDDETLRP